MWLGTQCVPKSQDYVHNSTIVGFSFSFPTSPRWEVLKTETLSILCVYLMYVDIKTLLQRGYFWWDCWMHSGAELPQNPTYLSIGPDWIQKITQPHTTHNNKETQCRATSATASAATHDPPTSVLAPWLCLPHYGQRWACSVFFILRWGVSCITFLLVPFKAKLRQSGATLAADSAAAHGSLPPILAQCACSPHYGQCQVHSVGSILRWGLPGVLKRRPIKK